MMRNVFTNVNTHTHQFDDVLLLKITTHGVTRARAILRLDTPDISLHLAWTMILQRAA